MRRFRLICLAGLLTSTAACDELPGTLPDGETDTNSDGYAGVLPGETWAGSPTEWTYPSDGMDLYARSAGEGEHVLVVINGGPGQSHDYCESVEPLATTAVRVVTFDQRGTGRSPRPQDADYTIDAYVSDLEALRQDLGVEKIHLLGHSFGGVFAIGYAATHPERVASLQLFASSPVTTWDLDSTEFERRIGVFEDDGTFPEGYNEIEGSNDCALYFQTIWPVYLHDSDFPMTDSLRATTCDLRTFFATNDSNMFGWDFTEDLRSFTAPTAVYYGESDPFRAESRAIPEHFTGAPVQEVEIPNCGHYWEECANTFLSEAADFLATTL